MRVFHQAAISAAISQTSEMTGNNSYEQTCTVGSPENGFKLRVSFKMATARPFGMPGATLNVSFYDNINTNRSGCMAQDARQNEYSEHP